MRVIWEESDIVAGRRYTLPGTNEVWLIGYRVDVDAEPGAAKRYVHISLNDGMVCAEASAAFIAPQLTAQGYVPLELVNRK